MILLVVRLFLSKVTHSQELSVPGLEPCQMLNIPRSNTGYSLLHMN